MAYSWPGRGTKSRMGFEADIILEVVEGGEREGKEEGRERKRKGQRGMRMRCESRVMNNQMRM